MTNFAQARTNMVDCQIHTAGVINPKLLTAFETVPKELFVPKDKRNVAYYDEEVPLGQGRHIIEPLILAKLLEAANIKETDVVLDIGGTTGYTAAILSSCASTILMLEENSELIDVANRQWAALELTNTLAVKGSLTNGYPEKAPYDVIIVNGATTSVSDQLKQQLAPNGRLLTIIKKPGDVVGKATIIQNLGENNFSACTLFDAGCSYIPAFQPKQAFSF